MADKRITQVSTEYDRDDYARTTDYLLGDRGSGSSFKMLIEEAVLGALESVTEDVGIGATTPYDRLYVNTGATGQTDVGYITVISDYYDTGTGGGAGIRFSMDQTSEGNLNVRFASVEGHFEGAYGSDMALIFRTTDNSAGSPYVFERLRITSDGTIRPGADDAQDLGAASYRFDDIYATNGTVQTSDRRLKSAIADSDLGLEFIKALRPVSFRRNGGARRHYGLIAQEVEAALAGRDFAGLIRDKTSGRYGLRYDELIGPLIKAVQELSQRVRELEQGAE